MTAAVATHEYVHSSGSSSTIDFPEITVIAGATLLAFMHGVTSGSFASSCSDTLGSNDSWTVSKSMDTTGNNKVRLYTLQNAAAGQSIIRVSSVTTPFNPVRGHLVQVTGVGTASVLDSAGIGNQSTPTTVADAVTSGLTGILIASPTFLVGWSHNNGGVNLPSAGSGFTDEGLGTTTPSTRSRIESKRLTATDAVAATFTATFNQSHYTACVVLLEIASGHPAGKRMGGIPFASQMKGVW